MADNTPAAPATLQSAPVLGLNDYLKANPTITVAAALKQLEQDLAKAQALKPRTNLQAAPGPIPVPAEIAKFGPAVSNLYTLLYTGVQKQAYIVNEDQAAAQKGKATGADPVDLATGQLLYSHNDLHINGAGIDFDLTRHYRSQARAPNGPMGVCWDYNYNLWLREVSQDEVVISSGEFREDRFTKVQGTADGQDYFAPPDGYHAILERVNVLGVQQYLLTRPDGMSYEYVSVDDPVIFRIARIADRFGNFLSFAYLPLPQSIVVTINDNNIPAFRTVRLNFDDLKRVTEILDYSGRQVQYNYNDYDDLVSVILPATREYRFGRSFFYEYSSEQGPLPHQLQSIVDADGRRYLETSYGDNENFTDAEKVTRQRDDEGEWLLEYADILSPDPSDITQPNRYTKMVKPTGHCIEYWFNKCGNALVKAETILDENSEKRQFITRSLYNDDGNLIAQLSPEKNLIQHIYGRDFFISNHFPGTIPTAAERKTFGNLLTTIKKAKTGIGLNFDLSTGVWIPAPSFTIFDIKDIITHYTYEPRFQQLSSRSDPRFTQNPAYFTNWLYNASGELEQVVYPLTSGPDPADVQKKSVIDFFEYTPQAKGRILRQTLMQQDPVLGLIIHPDNHTTEYGYFATPAKNGYPALITKGKGEVDQAITTFDVNSRGVQTKTTAANGAITSFIMDANDQPEIVSLQLNAMVHYDTSYWYTPEGKIRKNIRDIQDENGNLLLNEPETKQYKYNDFGLLLSERTGGNDFAKSLVIVRVYNSEGLASRIISADKSITAIRYDQRRLPVRTTLGFGTAEAVTSQIRYNGNLQQRAVEDGVGNVSWNDYDNFGRLSMTVRVVDIPPGASDKRNLSDRRGHTRLFSYDNSDSITSEQFFEWVKKDQYRLLSWKVYDYDERNRKIKTIDYLFTPGAVENTGVNWLKDLRAVPLPNAIPVESWTFYDGNGRVIEQREGVVNTAAQKTLGSSVRMSYDHSGRMTTTETWLTDKNLIVTKTETSFDGNGNPLRTSRTDYEYDSLDNLIKTEIITTEAVYDALNRKIKDIDGLGNTTSYAYDSRNCLIKKTDPAGNLTLLEYDIFGRKIKMTELAGTALPQETRYTYNADGQILSVSRGDVATNQFRQTDFTYNSLQKRTSKILAPGTAFERVTLYIYGVDGALIQRITPNGLSANFHYDRTSRLSKIEYDNIKAPTIVSDTAEFFSYDGLGNTVMISNDNTQTQYTFDSHGRCIQEDQVLNGKGVLTLHRVFDYLNNVTRLIYPSGRTIEYSYDLAGRLWKVKDVLRGIPNVGRPGGGARTLLTRNFIGNRERGITFENGVLVNNDYDCVGRIISTDHLLNNHSILQLIQLYNQNGNRGADWQAGTQQTKPATIYNYDALNRLTKTGNSISAIPFVGGFAPPALPGQPTGGQAIIDVAIGNSNIAAADITASFEYDEWNNRVVEKTVAVNNPLSFDDLNQLKTTTYDKNGNLVLDGTRTFQYDQHDRLVAVNDAGLIFTCTYDAAGRRVLLNNGNQQTRFAYDGITEIATYPGFVLQEEYVTTTRADGRILFSIAKKDYFIHTDIVGSTRMITDIAAMVTGRYDFQPYGRMDIAKNFAGFRYLFMGRDFDIPIQLYHFRARHYDPIRGRFLQNDPLDVMDGKSPYQAFSSNPLLYIDPLGTRDRILFPHGTAILPAAAANNSENPADLRVANFLVSAGKVLGLAGPTGLDALIKTTNSLGLTEVTLSLVVKDVILRRNLLNPTSPLFRTIGYFTRNFNQHKVGVGGGWSAWGIATTVLNTGLKLAGAPKEVTDVTEVAAHDLTPFGNVGFGLSNLSGTVSNLIRYGPSGGIGATYEQNLRGGRGGAIQGYTFIGESLFGGDVNYGDRISSNEAAEGAYGIFAESGNFWGELPSDIIRMWDNDSAENFSKKAHYARERIDSLKAPRELPAPPTHFDLPAPPKHFK